MRRLADPSSHVAVAAAVAVLQLLLPQPCRRSLLPCAARVAAPAQTSEKEGVGGREREERDFGRGREIKKESERGERRREMGSQFLGKMKG